MDNFRSTILGKFDVAIRLLEQLVDQTSVDLEIVDDQGNIVSPQDIRIDMPSNHLITQRNDSNGEGQDDERVERDEEIELAHFNEIRVGQKHRLIEQVDTSGTFRLLIQMFDDRQNEWATIHRF